MLGTTVVQRLSSPGIVKERHAPAAVAQNSARDMGGMEGLDMDSGLGRLMREAGENPTPDNLFATGRLLISQGSWNQAAIFLERARTMDVNNADIPYYLGYIAHQLGDHARAAVHMEESLALSNRAEVHLSTANILRYYVHDEAGAQQHLAAALTAPDCTEALRSAVLAEQARPAPATAQ